MMEWLPELAVAVLASVIAITLHEAAHGYAALALGDDTARRAGRLSLNPLRHVDPVGTLLLPGIMVVGQLLTIGRVEGMFGWAKPVPVNIWRLRNPRWGMVLVAAAGPMANFLLAWLAGIAAHPAGWAADWLSGGTLELVFRFLVLFIVANLVLGLFNLLPIPPLDGGRITAGLLPAPLALPYMRLERFGMLLVIGIVFLLPRLAEGVDPVGWALRHVVARAFNWVLLLSGNGGSV